ncbi:collagen alpha-5(VI) chain-like isoform X2 [Dreissena polymorpha]|uniref:collagen alpha-5(VI) chain-like isoform X2 n=1 Tax=Dreissena polymorpha TaxID=45954 RepID=UPI002264CA73|nr:collagen alpha-5(VI) chain-like isoform X2 [Dreissena polymorpha]
MVSLECMDCQQEEKHTVVKLGAKPCKFSEGQQEEKHAIVKRGAMPIHCYHKCPGGDDECYFDSNINDYRCKCPCRSQYCEYAEERCNNRGTCVPISGNTDFTCTNCISGWKGKQCHLIDCNSGVYCTNGGVCVDDVSSGTDYRCICKEGWTGKDCQFIDCSSPIRCMNGGQCHLQNGGKEFNCTCADGYLGENCQIDMCSPYKIADIVFVVDVSDSQAGTIFQKQKDFIKYFISQFPLGPLHFQFSLVVYAYKPHIIFYLNNTYDNDTIIDAVDHSYIPDDIRGATYTGKALAFVREKVLNKSYGLRSDLDRYVIILTDGMSSESQATVDDATLLHSSFPNIRIISIGTGEFVFHSGLLDVSGSRLNVFPLHGNDSVKSVLKSTMYGCERCKTAYSDVALAFDVTSFDYGELETMLKTAEVLIANLETEVNKSRVSLSKYVSRAERIFEFDQYIKSTEMIPQMYIHIHKRDTVMVGANYSTNPSNLSSVLHDIADTFQRNYDHARRKALVLFSQSKFNDHDDLAVKKLKDNDVTVIVVGIGLGADLDRMMQMSTSSFFTFIIGEDFNTPVDVIVSLLSTLEYPVCILS